jgi:hypothetical protein
VAQRSGVPAVGVTLVYWGFAVFGGACAIAFVAAPVSAKPFVPFLTLLPQLCWLGFVVSHARQSGVTRWG